MRGMILCLAVMVLGGVARGEVVVYSQTTANGAQQFSNSSQKIGQSFTNTSGQGERVGSVTFGFSVVSGSLSGTASVKIFATSGSALGYLPSGSVLATSQALDLTGFNSTTVTDKTFTFTSGAGLDLNQTYMAQLDISGLSGFGIGNYFNIHFQGTIPNSPSPLAGLNAYTNTGPSNSDVAQTYQLYGSIAMVPEPGTLLLGGIAAACGGGGVWWRRKRKAQVAETVETVTAV
jgi:hypothetical protein